MISRLYISISVSYILHFENDRGNRSLSDFHADLDKKAGRRPLFRRMLQNVSGLAVLNKASRQPY